MDASALDLGHVRRALLIDDEAAVRGVLRRWLGRRGWAVTEAADGELARSRLQDLISESSPTSYDLVICDLRMPSLSGPELHAWAKVHQPALIERLVFASGDVREPAAAAFLQQCGCPVLEKPFEFVRLEEVIASLTDAP
ncbi:MAG: response regulator [Gemmatimonadota bacterium]